jgi:hypothetical protein
LDFCIDRRNILSSLHPSTQSPDPNLCPQSQLTSNSWGKQAYRRILHFGFETAIRIRIALMSVVGVFGRLRGLCDSSSHSSWRRLVRCPTSARVYLVQTTVNSNPAEISSRSIHTRGAAIAPFFVKSAGNRSCRILAPSNSSFQRSIGSIWPRRHSSNFQSLPADSEAMPVELLCLENPLLDISGQG